MKNAIETKNLIKKYDDSFELGPINLKIPQGMIVGLIGENGAGKTTLIKTILNIINATSGEVSLFGHSSLKDLEDIGIVLDDAFFPEILNPKEVNSTMKDIYTSWDSNLFFKYLDDFHIDKNKQIRTFSKGMRKKLEIATALSHHPKLLILDEPTSGLDPVVRDEVLELFLNFLQDEEHTILLSTHITSDLEHVADRIVFIKNGKVALEKDKDELLDNYGILKCDEEFFKKMEPSDILFYKKEKYDIKVLVEDKKRISQKYKESIIDKITLEDLMILMIKGEEKR